MYPTISKRFREVLLDRYDLSNASLSVSSDEIIIEKAHPLCLEFALQKGSCVDCPLWNYVHGCIHPGYVYFVIYGKRVTIDDIEDDFQRLIIKSFEGVKAVVAYFRWLHTHVTWR